MTRELKWNFNGKLLGIKHGSRPADETPVEEVFNRFTPHVKRGNTLYIEFPETEIRAETPTRLGAGYNLLIDYARNHGMRVVALDTPALNRVVRKLKNQTRMSKLAEKIRKVEGSSFNPEHFVDIMHAYATSELRERRWASLLRNTKKGDIIVMHPTHAVRIAERMGIGGDALVLLHELDSRTIAWYKLMLATNRLREARESLHHYNSLRARRPLVRFWRGVKRVLGIK